MMEPLQFRQREQSTLERHSIEQHVVRVVERTVQHSGRATNGAVGPDTALIGGQAVLDSMGLVTALVDLEQELESLAGRPVTITDERAMSQSRSPFRSVGALTDYITELLK